MTTHIRGMVQNPPNQPLPFPDIDPFGALNLLPEDEKEWFLRIRKYLQEEVRPQVTDYWNREEFPFHLLEGMAEVGLARLETSGTSWLFRGLVYAEVTRVDVSLSALVGIHNELVLGMINALGSEEQKKDMLRKLENFELTGAFALTEPTHGSDIAGGLETSATFDGENWIIKGEKRWIGMGTIADFALVWARDTADQQIKAFIVPTDTPGYSAEKISNKIGLRIMQNAHITLDNVSVPASAHLPGAVNFDAANEMLRNSRAWVGWQGYGIQIGIFDIVREYATTREQFGKPLAKFQLVQKGISEIMSNAQAALGLMMNCARMQENGTLDMVHAAMAKATATRFARQSAALGREVLGGNGITTDYEMAKFFGDAEILYTYEGTYEINSLIVGRALTGYSAFV